MLLVSRRLPLPLLHPGRQRAYIARAPTKKLFVQPSYITLPSRSAVKMMTDTDGGKPTRAASPGSDTSPSSRPAAKKPRLNSPDTPHATPGTASPSLRASDATQPKRGPKKTGPTRTQKRKAQHGALPEFCSHDDVLWREIKEVLGAEYVDGCVEAGTGRDSPLAYHAEVDVEVKAISSTGSAVGVVLGSAVPWAVIVPFSLPGEIVRAKIYRNARMHSFGDFKEVVKPNLEWRDDSRVQCQYFAKCGGCQYQMLSYEKQLELKRDVVVKAYQNFSGLEQSTLPTIGTTMPSPEQYNYRTKLTPHFEAPNSKQRKEQDNRQSDTERPDWFRIGFNESGSQRVIDIEDCPIATSVIRETLPAVRENAIKKLFTYKKGVSLILRDSLPLSTDKDADPETHICVTDHKGTVREKVGPWIFEYPNGSFFQNNNGVLPFLTDYVQTQIFSDAGKRPTHLIDAYCGSGLFAITLSPHFERVAGIELSTESIRAATRNAQLNSLPSSKISFRAGDAGDIFQVIGDFPPEDSVLLIDPPRKGTDESFIKQMLMLRPRTVVYVSCNVHTQARDIGMMLRGSEADGKRRYVLESLRGFDLFPQTAHVESVAVLRLAPAEE
ncbi:unnamed protein product [Mycena citricolor]|uniref:TRAM domain-containing protein n=1 Tax=Mycena citricolor TaxID=2018698 RepID=A0AAD2HVE4_9AGAR|nr:unnamed protein product [Mycena citricolor]CAK5282014.1 unnamed protein product [Mycena citricolor]